MPSPSVAVGRLFLVLALCGHGRARDLLPNLELLGHDVAMLGGGEPVAPRSEVFGNGTIRGEETLHMTGYADGPFFGDFSDKPPQIKRSD
jgi:hypothetical protein